MKQFEQLHIWMDARLLVNEIYEIHKVTSDFSFKDQIQRATVSIMNNIAEGFESGSNLNFIKYLNIAKASCAEVRSMLYLSEDFKICNKLKAKELRESTLKIASGIYQLINYLKNQPKK